MEVNPTSSHYFYPQLSSSLAISSAVPSVNMDELSAPVHLGTKSHLPSSSEGPYSSDSTFFLLLNQLYSLLDLSHQYINMLFLSSLKNKSFLFYSSFPSVASFLCPHAQHISLKKCCIFTVTIFSSPIPSGTHYPVRLLLPSCQKKLGSEVASDLSVATPASALSSHLP